MVKLGGIIIWGWTVEGHLGGWGVGQGGRAGQTKGSTLGQSSFRGGGHVLHNGQGEGVGQGATLVVVQLGTKMGHLGHSGSGLGVVSIS